MILVSSLDFITEIRNLSSKDEISDLFKLRMSEIGTTQFTYRLSHIPDDIPSKFLCTTYRQDWAEYYFSNRLNNVDPVVKRLKASKLPFIWGDHWNQILSKDDQMFFSQAGEFGYRDGIAIPLYKTSNEASALTLVPDVKRRDFFAWNSHYFPHIHSLAILFNEGIISLFADNDTISLTEREKECLLWTANGKTNWEISTLLSISPSTVKFHLTNSRTKLSVHSKHQAVLKAIEKGLISP